MRILYLILPLGMVLVLFQVGASAQTCKYNSVAATAPASRFDDNGDGTVTDTATGLHWKRCSEGQTWDGATCSGTATTHSWKQALQLADGASYAGEGDWHLPNIKELASIVELACFYPTINLDVFPGTPSSLFWCDSPSSGYLEGGRAWYVNFYNGTDGTDYKTDDNYVRLVRAGQ